MRVSDEQELSAAIAGAAGPLQIVGGGTRWLARPALLGRASLDGVSDQLELGGLSGITLYEPGALTMVAQAGTPVAEVAAALAAEGQCLPFEPNFAAAGVSTIGGVMATNASGPRRVMVGAARDFCLGVRFVDGMGQVIKNGGRVMKNVTGYDLVKLLAGSWGTLGAISEVSFKVLPQPETECSLRLDGSATGGSAEGPAIAAMAAALGSPFEVSGAAHGAVSDTQAATYVRVEGFEASVKYRAGKLADLLAPYGPVEVIDNAEASRAIWQAIRDLDPFREKAYVARASIKPSDFTALQAALAGRFGMQGGKPAGCDMMLDWGGGLVWIAADAAALAENAAPGGSDDDLAVQGGQVLHEFLQQHLSGGRGHATLTRAPAGLLGRVAIFQPEAPGVAALTRGLRAKFDPRGLFNPDLNSGVSPAKMEPIG